MFVYIQNCAEGKKFSVRMMCAALPVSERGFYKWKVNKGKPKAWQKLLAQMHEILEEDEENKNYGVRRMQIALEQRGIKCSLSTVRSTMARGNLLHEDRRSPDGLTKADKKVEGYYVSTVGLNEATIAKYIREQEAHDIAMDKVTEKEYEDPFKGGK